MLGEKAELLPLAGRRYAPNESRGTRYFTEPAESIFLATAATYQSAGVYYGMKQQSHSIETASGTAKRTWLSERGSIGI